MKVLACGGPGVCRIVYVRPSPCAQSVCRGARRANPLVNPSWRGVYPVYSARHPGLLTLDTHGSASRGLTTSSWLPGVHTQDQTLIVAAVRDRPPPSPVEEVR